MLLKRGKHLWSVCLEISKYLGRNRKHRWLIWVFPIAGLLSLLWFLVRVVPKPSRAVYPCQRVAAPLASSFIVWVVGLIGSTLAYRKAKRLLRQSRYVVAGICVAVAVLAVWWPLSITSDNPAQGAFTPTDPPNSPVGVAKGIYPGRVVWVHEPNATSWDGSTGAWWDDTNTDHDVVDSMISKAVQCLTRELNDTNAWDALFRHFNQTKGFGDVAYQQGEQIAVKINMNQDDGAVWTKGKGVPSPHVVYSVLDQLINVVGVPGSAITVYDASRYIGDPIYDKVRSNPDPNFQNVKFVVRPDLAGSGRVAVIPDVNNPIYYGNPSIPDSGYTYMPLCVTKAKYLINMALFRQHGMFGITLCGKNHFGSVHFTSTGEWIPSPLHDYGRRTNSMETYNCLVDLIGHECLGKKTLLYMVDGLYSAERQGIDVIRFESFGDDWCSSIFASQDPVAIDSVGLDFLRNEPKCDRVEGSVDNYLHEAAEANNPPSGTFYDPEGDGTQLASLGVHEHWNNATDKQYSRNLGTGDGIELVVPVPTSVDGPIENLSIGKRYDYIQYAIDDAIDGEEIVASPGTYYENINFKGKNLTVSSVDPNEPAVVAATVINGGVEDSAVTFWNQEDANCVLAGVTITGGSRGIYCRGASPTISNCVIDKAGGIAIELDYSSEPIITGCTIIGDVIVRVIENLDTGQRYGYIQQAIDDAADGNEIVASPGTYYENIDFKGKNVTVRSTKPNDPAVVAVTVISGSQVVTFSSSEDANCVLAGFTITGGNKGIHCSGASPTISNCTIAENTVEGIYTYAGNPIIANCIIAGNGDAGIYCDQSDPTIANCIIAGNGADGIYCDQSDPTITNCIIAENGADGIYCDQSYPTITNCTIAENGASGIYFNLISNPLMKNCIIWGNTGPQLDGGRPSIMHSCIQDWTGTRWGNINSDPCFIDPNNGDYHLKSEAGRWDPNSQSWVTDANTSDCIDAGNPDSNWTAELWPHGKLINMGAYGGTPQASMSLSSVGNVADLIIDDAVNFRDFARLANGWQREEVLLAEDLDRNGVVDFDDIDIFGDNWLWEQ